VAKTGSDSNSGSASSPFLTINKAKTSTLAGDVVLVRAGTYLESANGAGVYFGGSNGGTASAPITYRGYPGETVVIDGSSGGGSTIYISTSNLNFTSLRITGAHGTGWAANGSNLRLAESELDNNNVIGPASSGAGVNIQNVCTNVKVFGNKIHHNGSTTLDHGLYVKGNAMELAWNEVHHNFGYGIHLYDTNSLTFTNADVHSNVSYANGLSGILVSSGASGARVYNNVSYGNTQAGLALLYNPTGTRAYNNTFHGNGAGNYYQIWVAASANTVLSGNVVTGSSNRMISIESSATGVTADYSLYGSDSSTSFKWRGTTYTFQGYRQASGLDSHTSLGDPLYVSAAGSDFHLGAGSPAIDGADVTNAAALDLENRPRTAGAGPDKGAFEFASGSSGTPPPTPQNLRRTDKAP
jgi:parallel beta-helix repeat protein